MRLRNAAAVVTVVRMSISPNEMDQAFHPEG